MTTSIRKRLYIKLESRENLDSFSLSITVRNIPNRICKTASNFGRRSSRCFEYAECGYFTLLFCKERQRNEQRIITHACSTAIVLVAVAVEVQLVIKNSLKLNKRQNNEQPNELNSNERPVEQDDG